MYGKDGKPYRGNGGKQLYGISKDAAGEVFGLGGPCSYPNKKIWGKSGAIVRKASGTNTDKVQEALGFLNKSLELRRKDSGGGHDHMTKNVEECAAALADLLKAKEKADEGTAAIKKADGEDAAAAPARKGPSI